MEKFASDNLILLEFLVDSVNLEFGIEQSLKCLNGVTCVSFQFLDNAPLFVSEEDFQTGLKDYKKSCAIKQGKSCLFGLSPEQAKEALEQFDVFIEVYKKMCPGTLPEKVHIGESLVSIVNLFKDLVEAASEKRGEAPVAKSMQDCFKIEDSNGNKVGMISLFVRMSCFGKIIVSQLQVDFHTKALECKTQEGHYMFEYEKILNKPIPYCNDPHTHTSSHPARPVVPETYNTPSASPSEMQGALSSPENSSRSPSSCSPGFKTSCPPCPPPSCCSQPHSSSTCPPPSCCSKPPCPSPSCRPICTPPTPSVSCQNYPPNPPPCSTPTCSNIPCYHPCTPNPPPTCCYTSPCYSPPCYPPCYKQPPCALPPCCKPPPPPPVCEPCAPIKGEYREIDAFMGGNSLLIRMHKDSATVEKVEDNQTESNTNSSCSCQFPKMGCCPPRGCPPPSPCCHPVCNSPCCPPSNLATGDTTLKLSGAGCLNPNTICITQPNTPGATPDGRRIEQILDERKELFVLRVNKKKDKPNKKSNLELELCTPKAQEIKKPPVLTETSQQCEVSAFSLPKKR